jgi:dihydropteroate synthase
MFLCGKFKFDLSRPLVMGIVNVTPDSFSDGGCHLSTGGAIAHARKLIEDGADILDIGGESTRPGAATVSEQEELDRILHVIEGLRGISVPISVDTYKPGVMRAALVAVRVWSTTSTHCRRRGRSQWSREAMRQCV